MTEGKNDCMNCGYCHDCIVAAMEASYEAEANVWIEENKSLKAERAELRAEIERLKELNDWQNMPNRNPSYRGGYEFYINEEWACLRAAAIDETVDMSASLMKARFDPDDERVRVRLVKDDDALLDDLKQAETKLVETNIEAERLRVDNVELLAKIEMLMNEASILRDLIKELSDEINPPERNCSCHIFPPCSDCVDHEHARELKKRAESYIS